MRTSRIWRQWPLVLILVSAVADAQQKKAVNSPLDPEGRPDEKLMDQPARYYVWYDSQGWHLRTAAKGLAKFEGTIRITGGQVQKCRPIGLEMKGTARDQWSLDTGRQTLKFLIQTSTAFDGFDFTVDGDATELEFDLLIGGNKRPRRVFVGRKAGTPTAIPFSLPAKPE